MQLIFKKKCKNDKPVIFASNLTLSCYYVIVVLQEDSIPTALRQRVRVILLL